VSTSSCRNSCTKKSELSCWFGLPMKCGQGDRVEADRTEKGENTDTGITRRSLFVGVGAAAVMMGFGGFKFVEQHPIIRPPGVQDEQRLLAACIRCERCYEICPRHVITPAHFEHGVLNMRTPTFDFSADYCDWCAAENDGNPLCVKTCPTRALELPEGATVTNTIIGKAEIDFDSCLAYRVTGCHFCYDACPFEAIELDEQGRPFVLRDKCNGCGACESVCVSLQNGSLAQNAKERAIIIRPTGKA
jgi:ferredoxin-type protein NapG